MPRTKRETPPNGGVFYFRGDATINAETAELAEHKSVAHNIEFSGWGRRSMDFTKLDGLIPAVIQDAQSAEVLMVGFMNEDALAITKRTGYATFFSRTRNTLWTKGETSGNRLEVVEMLTDCDDDTVLLKVKRLGDGNVCHTGERTCFYRKLSNES